MSPDRLCDKAYNIVAAGTPDPADVLVAATGAQIGILRGIPCLLGLTIGTGGLLGAAALVYGKIILEQPRMMYSMKFGGAILLLWLAWKIATSPPASKIGNKEPVGFVLGLVQLSMLMAGDKVQRDSDLQEQSVGTPLGFAAMDGGLQRGDLIFWKGHVGIMRDGETLIHANCHPMSVATEKLEDAIERIGYLYGFPRTLRRP